MNELRKLEANIGFVIGILIGAFGAWILILFFTPWQWYFKLISSIGSLGIIGSLGLSLNELIKARRNYIETMDEMKKINEASNKIIEQKQEEEEVLGLS